MWTRSGKSFWKSAKPNKTRKPDGQTVRFLYSNEFCAVLEGGPTFRLYQAQRVNDMLPRKGSDTGRRLSLDGGEHVTDHIRALLIQLLYHIYR